MASKLFDELKIGSMTMRNATFMAPMSLGYESPDGTVNETLQEYWLARARGGVGCIITDALSVDPAVPYLGNTLCFRGEESIRKYGEFVDKIHREGAKIIPQVTHPGPESISAFYGVPPVASSVYLNSMGQKTRALAVEELPEIVNKYAQTAWNAKQAGFDGIELHCAHAYMLLGSFLSPMRNKRLDDYGGSLDNRARLLLEVLDAIKAACGDDFPVILRMSGTERSDQGNTLEDMKYLVPILEEHGVDAFEISGGTQYEACNKIIACHGEERGLNVPQAEAIKAVAKVPVIVVGKINEPEYAKYLMDSGKVDGVVIGRALLSDAEFVKKAQEGRNSEIAPCTACAIGCVGEQSKRHPASCVINPALGRETSLVLKPCGRSKKVAVVGGGIGGAAAARAFTLCGHKVTLFEKEEVLGGQMRLACVPPHKQEISKWMVYLTDEMNRLNVDVRLKTAADVELLKAEGFDVVVLATGARPALPPAEGIDPAKAVDAWQVISQEVPVLAGNVLVVGGGMVGCEVCELLIHQSRGPMKVTMIEMLDDIGAGMVVNNKVPAMKRLAALGIRMMPGTKLISVTGDSAVVECAGQTMTLDHLTQIIYACGSKSDNPLYEDVKEAFEEVYLIGDANAPAQALEAVCGAWEAAVEAGK